MASSYDKIRSSTLFLLQFTYRAAKMSRPDVANVAQNNGSSNLLADSIKVDEFEIQVGNSIEFTKNTAMFTNCVSS